jgi:hypothetical protein
VLASLPVVSDRSGLVDGTISTGKDGNIGLEV